MSDLPAVVEDVNQALSYEHVKRTLTSGIQKLESTTNVFLKRIVSSKEYIPFGLLYMISELKEIMQIKFGGNKKGNGKHTNTIDIPPKITWNVKCSAKFKWLESREILVINCLRTNEPLQ